METREEILNYLTDNNGNIITRRIIKRSFAKRFPLFYNSIKDCFRESVYMLIHNMNERPSCPICNTPNKIKHFKAGFRKSCSRKCADIVNSISEEFSKKIKEGQRNKFNEEYYSKKHNGDIVATIGNRYLLVSGKTIDRNQYLKLHNHNKKYEDTVECFLTNYEKFKYKLKEEWFIDYFPNVYKIIMESMPQHLDFHSKKYLFVHGMEEFPKCKVCNIKDVYVTHQNQITKTCNNYNCRRSTSNFEREVFSFVKSVIPNEEILTNFRFDKQEHDIHIPSLKLSIECNGLYWHGENYKKNTYHQIKKTHSLSHNIDLIMIWEDDWNNKRSIIESMLKHKLKVCDTKIYARNCTISEISYRDSESFLNQNHLQGSVVSSKRYGLNHNDDLIAVMTFGKPRRIMGEKQNQTNVFELLRFAIKMNYHVPGAFSKLMQMFEKECSPHKIYSYASYDHSNGNVYETNGFKKTKFTTPGYTWVVNKDRFHRSNFMKMKLIKMGHDPNKTESEIMMESGSFKIWDSGNIKYEKLYI